MGVVESVPKPRKRDGNPLYLRVVTLHAQIALFPEKRFQHSRKIPRVSCSDFAPFLLRFSSVILQHGENHASETTERFLRFYSVFFLFKDTKEILQSWCAILVHGVGMPRPINLISSVI